MRSRVSHSVRSDRADSSDAGSASDTHRPLDPLPKLADLPALLFSVRVGAEYSPRLHQCRQLRQLGLHRSALELGRFGRAHQLPTLQIRRACSDVTELTGRPRFLSASSPRRTRSLVLVPSYRAGTRSPLSRPSDAAPVSEAVFARSILILSTTSAQSPGRRCR